MDRREGRPADRRVPEELAEELLAAERLKGPWFLRIARARIAVGNVPLFFTALIFFGPWMSGLPGQAGVHAENAGHFRIIGLLAGACAAVLGLRARWILRSAAILTLAHAAAILSYSLPPGAPARASAARPAPLRICYANLGWPRDRRAADFARWVRKENPDLIALTEFDHESDTDLLPLFAEYPHSVVQMRGDRFGVAIYSKVDFTETWIGAIDLYAPPSIRVRIADPEVEIWVVHPFPPGDPYTRGCRDGFLALLAEEVRARNLPQIVIGDLNTTERTKGFRALGSSGLLDSRKGYGWSPTWAPFQSFLRPLNILFAIPLDHVFVSREIAVQDRRVGENFGSDHLPIVLDVEGPRE